MADNTNDNKKKKEEVKVSLSKSSVPTDLSKYPKVSLGGLGKDDKAETLKTQIDGPVGEEPNAQSQEDIKVSLSKSSVPTDLSKYPKITVNDQGNEERSLGTKEQKKPRSQSKSIQTQEDLNVLLSKSSVPTDLSKYPKITIDSAKNQPSHSKEDPGTSKPEKQRKEQAQEDLNVSLSKSSVPTDLSKYPKITVNGQADRDKEAIETESATRRNTKKEQTQEDLNVSLSKSSVPTDLSKYPKITVNGQADRDKEAIETESATRRNTKKEQTQEDLNVSLSKSSVPTDLSKYPKITVNAQPDGEKESKSVASSKPEKEQTQENLNISLSKSSVPMDLSKYPKITINAQAGNKDKVVKEESKSAAHSKTEKEQAQENLNISLSKSSVPTDLSKYPKITVNAEQGKKKAPEKGQSESDKLQQLANLGKSEVPISGGRILKDAQSPVKPKMPKQKSSETPNLGSDPISASKEFTTSIDNEPKANQTVHLKKNLKVTLRKSARALDLTKYPKVTIEDEKDAKAADIPAKNESSTDGAVLPKIKFADHVADGSGRETVHLQQNLKLSLSSSENAVDLSKYQRVSLPPNQKVLGGKGKSQIKDSKKDVGTSEAAVDIKKIPQVPDPLPVENQDKVAVPAVKDKQEIPAPAAIYKETKVGLTPVKKTEIPPPPASKKSSKEEIREEDLKVTLKKPRKDFVGEEKQASKPTLPEIPVAASSVKKPKQILTHTSRSIPKIVDPARMRDDASPKRQSHSNFASAKNEAGDKSEPGSDTVVLKVIKEKKKKLAGILSASQTIRLRPAGEEGETPSGLGGYSGAGTPTERIASKKTLKLKSPVLKPKSPEPSTKVPDTVHRPNLKMKSAPQDSGEDKAGTGNSQKKQATVQLGKSSIKHLAGSAPKATLKIKVPSPGAGVNASPERQLKATLKIKTPKAGTPASTAKKQAPPPPMASAANQNRSQQAGGRPGRTLKLKAVPRPQAPQQAAQLSSSSPLTGTHSGRERPQAFQASKQQEKAPVSLEADVSYTISAAASLIAMGIVSYLLISQFSSLFL